VNDFVCRNMTDLQMIWNSSVATLLLLIIMVQAYSVFSLLMVVKVTPVAVCQLHWCFCFESGKSVHSQSAVVKYCSLTVLKVLNGFLPWCNLQPLKIPSLHTAFLWHTASGGAMLTPPH
jgi:hypothetical protein